MFKLLLAFRINVYKNNPLSSAMLRHVQQHTSLARRTTFSLSSYTHVSIFSSQISTATPDFPKFFKCLWNWESLIHFQFIKLRTSLNIINYSQGHAWPFPVMFSGWLVWPALTSGLFSDPGEEGRSWPHFLGIWSPWHLRGMPICMKHRSYDEHQCPVQVAHSLFHFRFSSLAFWQ